MSDLVILFFDLIQLMVKHPEESRAINWKFLFFEKQIQSLDPMSELYTDAMQMSAELALCRRRRRSRRRWYNLSNLDDVVGSYHIHESPTTLHSAWDLFYTGRYKTEGVA
mgnify:CR=1 FL=1